MTFQDIADALAWIAKDEGLPVTSCNGNTTIQNGLRSMGLVVCGDHDLSFYFKSKLGPGLIIDPVRSVDAALSRGLDFIYANPS